MIQQQECNELDQKYLEDNYANLSTITVLDLSKKSLTSKIETKTFDRLTQLEKLYLHVNKIEQIEPKAFDGLTNLVELHLNTNRLDRIKSGTFKSLTRLEKLFLQINQIEVIEPKAFDGLVSLKTLDLQKNKLNRIDGGIFESLTKLEVLKLDKNQIETIDSGVFEGLANLKQLWLYENKLKQIENQTFKPLVRLEFLDINNNQIETIESSAFDGLSNLKQLYLACNKLNNLDRSCFRYFNSIGFVELVYNKFDTKIVSYFNKKVFLKWNPDYRFFTNNFFQNILYLPVSLSISEYESYLLKNSPFTSNFEDFLNQFPEISQSSSNVSNTKSLINLLGKSSLNNVSSPTHSGLDDAESSNSSSLTRIFVPIDDPLEKKTLKNFSVIGPPLGKGAFGQVYLVKNKRNNSNQLMAMKIMNLDEVAQNETYILTQLDHENIVKYLEHFEINSSSPNNKNAKLCIVTEFCERGDLGEQIKYKASLKEDFEFSHIFNWILQATYGVHYLHSFQPKGIIHRDIKPENMLLSNDLVIKLADLGLSRLTSKSSSVYSLAGTREYMSPEMYRCLLNENQSYSFKTDIWSLGCVFYEIINLKKAFPNGQESNPSVPDLSQHQFFSPLLERMLQKEQKDRVDSQTLNNEFMDNQNFLKSMGVVI